MKVFLLFLSIIIIIYLLNHKKEPFSSDDNLSALSRPELQKPPSIDIDQIDFKNLTPEEYARLISRLQQSDERPIIKNLPVFV